MSDDLEGDDIWGDSGGDDNNNKKPDSGNEEGKSDDTEGGTGIGNNNNPAEDDDDAASSSSSQPAVAPPVPAVPVPAPPIMIEEDEETRYMSISELRQRIHLISNDIRVMNSDVHRISHESRSQIDRIVENKEKVKINKQLPYLVANVVEILEPDAEDGTFIQRFCYVFKN
jgi:hypothetical protein